MSTPTTPQAALALHHAALADRAEALARQFQVLSQLLSTTDPQSPDYLRRLNLLLRLHKVLQAFDPDPADQPPETAPADTPEAPRTTPPKPVTVPSAVSVPHEPSPTTDEPSFPPIQNLKSKIQNETVRRAFTEKLAS